MQETEIRLTWDKFKAYWEELGKPLLECKGTALSAPWVKLQPHDTPGWFDHVYYRIAGDRHWELRLRWINSDKTLPIEYEDAYDDWYLIDTNITDVFWNHACNYREALQPTKQKEPMKDDGKSTTCYDIPAGAKTLDDLIEYKKMPFWLGTIFKVCYAFEERSSRNAAANKLRELNKIGYYQQRGLNLLNQEIEPCTQTENINFTETYIS